jgi:hypothetical protein
MNTAHLIHYLALSVVGVALIDPMAGAAQNAKPKGEARPTGQRQQLDPKTQRQSLDGQESDAQILIYRFRLNPDAAGSELIVSNPSDQEGTFSLVAQEADGSFSKEAEHSITPGSVYAIRAADAGWSSTNVVSVKASARLVLSLQFPDADQPVEIARNPSVGIYDVFGFGRQTELRSSGKKRGLSLLFSDGSFTQELPREAAPQQAVSELLQTSGRSPARGLFVLRGN